MDPPQWWETRLSGKEDLFKIVLCLSEIFRRLVFFFLLRAWLCYVANTPGIQWRMYSWQTVDEQVEVYVKLLPLIHHSFKSYTAVFCYSKLLKSGLKHAAWLHFISNLLFITFCSFQVRILPYDRKTPTQEIKGSWKGSYAMQCMFSSLSDTMSHNGWVRKPVHLGDKKKLWNVELLNEACQCITLKHLLWSNWYFL